MSSLLSDLLSERDYLLADGATGTNMMGMGLPAGQAPDLWNLEKPENVTWLHASFIEVGADIILTNTFGANRCRLQLDNAQEQTREINEAGARIARAAADAAGRPVVVAGAMGPTGEMLMPYGTLTDEEAEATFAEQAQALAEGGADVLWIETIFAFGELKAAVAAAASVGLPAVLTMTFDTAGRTMMGDTPEKAREFIQTLDPQPIASGANCGAGPAMLIDTLCRFRRAGSDADVLIGKGNCGVPQMVGGEIVYSGNAKIMARYARLARDAGARIIGGCCGTTPAYLKAIGEALAGYQPGDIPDVEAIEAALGPINAPAPGAA
ncbi:MAG: betaine--homocysteine S-methyltransferase [Deltaproteobacteria bacterium]|jgi:5-methyltetrahydrofolate--homocysteine methyltransferase|nr:betaine--homocysteine S-methyltransferase [Deltaproteobacteria bacterium]MBW2543461.1 betaine--homocysteine S-methyltransferase [Deltaproteobacteria bacterium]